ncbi:MAG: DNA translocase FtsK 4TM domain-containing protein [Candidatus Brocadiae bacterium]|nr:DNA translocase FtsK 4TM domain-containing protein [Candidatus Brocadiia bacterium]
MNKRIPVSYILKILSILFFFYFFLALFSYELRDMGHTYPRQPKVGNWMGGSGAILAHYSFLWLGQVSWLMPFILAFGLWKIEKQSMYFYSYWFCYLFFFFLWLCTLGSFWEKFCIDSDRMPSQGGLLGLFLLENLQLFFGNFHAFFLLFAGIILGIYAFTIVLQQKYLTKIQRQEKKE